MISETLIQMKPVLLPTVRWWRKKIENEIKFIDINDSKTITFVEKFWFHWKGWSNNKKDIKVISRTISEWCRGEKLDITVTPRIFPWWKIE